ncbi:uncharacterized protein LOC130654772 [Hydractinia symbiolongicarpus]|uniref:uncharacterized protein LOC130654772 n=1 Tax=Hydractinia symbiolongicarpus TaxID=13093 RepID=UPI00254F4D54|nr:uncharacterized protein LOC130654772 [Hydractinia symbiolongicarpus]
MSEEINATVCGPTKQYNKTEKIMQSVVKLFVQMSTPNYSMPWQMKRQQQTSGSGFIISNRRILTNGHVVAYQKSVRVRKHGDAKKYHAHVIHVAHECDIAMVGVSDDAFWEGLEALEFGDIPQLEEDIVVVGFPTGGDNISVTRGVVSRVDIQRYSHSGAHLLAIQIDAAINAGNSGGPALKDGKVVGIAFETLDNAENIGYIIPIPVVSHFLEDISRNEKFSGFCNLGIRWQPIESDHMRTYFKLTPKDSGILISRSLKLSCSYNHLQRGDVLMGINGVNIADDGTVPFRGNERILWNYLIHSKFPQEVIEATILRSGKKKTVEVALEVLTFLVPPQLYDRRPSYVVYCGLVFVSLSQPYMLHQYGKDWGRKAPIRLCDRILYGVQEKKNQEVIVLSQVLASELTAGYDSFSNLQIYRVNGIPVLNLKHLCHILDKLTLPHSGKSETAATANLINSGASDRLDNIEPALRRSENGRDSPESTATVSLTDRERESYTSFDKLSGGVEIGDDLDRTVESAEVEKRLHKLQQEDRLYSEFTSETQNLYYGAGDDPLLLDCTNFIHFELDKDKVIVFDIASAHTKNLEILRQYAISLPRSENLPCQQY